MFMIPDLNFDVITSHDQMHNNIHLVILKLHKIKLIKIHHSLICKLSIHV